MKNLYIIPTDKPSKIKSKEGIFDYSPAMMFIKEKDWIHQNIYITSNEVPKLDEWGINTRNNVVFKCKGFTPDKEDLKYDKKIILTTDIDLIKDIYKNIDGFDRLVEYGVQAIDDEFLEWFVKNPSCEFVEIKWVKTPDGIFYHQDNVPYGCYKIIIPKEEITGDEFDIVIKPTYNKTFNASLKIFPKEKPKEEIPNDLDSVLAKISDVNDLEISNWYEVVYYYDNKWYSYNGSKTFNNDEQVLEWKYCKEIF